MLQRRAADDLEGAEAAWERERCGFEAQMERLLADVDWALQCAAQGAAGEEEVAQGGRPRKRRMATGPGAAARRHGGEGGPNKDSRR